MAINKIKSKAKVVPIKSRKSKIVELTLAESLANEFLEHLRENNIPILGESIINGYFFFLVAPTKSLTVTTKFNSDGFQPHDKVTTQKHTLLYAVQIGETSIIEAHMMPKIFATLKESGAKIVTISSEYELKDTLTAVCK